MLMRSLAATLFVMAGAAPAAAAAVAGHAAGGALRRLRLGQLASLALQLAFVVLKHADDGEGQAIDKEGLAHGDDLAAHLLRRAPARARGGAGALMCPTGVRTGAAGEEPQNR